MTYDSPFWAIVGSVANFKEEGLVTPEGWGEKLICWFMQGIEPRSSWWNASADHYTIQTLLPEGVDFNKVYNIIRDSN